ncbi:type I polyketide synthase [Streptomyces fuscichromogenes]|uniref:type I polyketide synthase n=1 Tax=Streptomyces fuscichromogenes TaxID=1324013 RepID=UPI0037FD7617
MAAVNAVAVVGLDCVFPAARGAEAYWDLLMRGGDAIGPLPADRRGYGLDHTVRGGFLDDAAAFDSDFFTLAPREAAAMDPQQRLLLQCAWRALEDSGRSPASLADTDAGVFIGVMGSEWAQLHMADHTAVTPQLGAGSSAGMTANRISYHLNLKGPSLAVDTACSSSLVAVHLAVNSLLAGECSTALAGGANIVLTPALGMVYRQMGLMAPDGRCKPFSRDADGIGRSDGAGVVVLRRLEDALADGQRVYAVVRGTAVNQDGRSNGVTAPNKWSQRAVVAAAYRRAGVRADQISFIEAHGTGTALGDIIECAALGELHAVPRTRPCAIGSVKGNIGHTEAAAGIAGLIKTALALHHRTVPASRFATAENPQLRLAERGLSLLSAPVRLPAGEVFAGVSSFGMGGTNAHAVLAGPPRGPRPGRRGHPAAGVFTLSADTPEALRRNLAAQAETLARRPRGDAAAVCWTSNRAKTGLPHRAAFTARDTAELAEALRRAAADHLPESVADHTWRPAAVGFLYSGPGCQEPGMTAALYREHPLYRRHLDDIDDVLAPHTGASVRDLILGGDAAVHRTRWALPAQFAVACALTRTLAGLGVLPDAVLGHGAGEYAAAVAAGVLELPDAARLVAAHAAAADALPESAMLAVRGARAEIEDVLSAHPQLFPAALDGPRDLVLAGPAPELEQAAETLAERGLHVRALRSAHPAHGPAAAAVADRIRTAFATVSPARPGIVLASTRHGRTLADETMDAAYWAGLAVEPVRFADALSALVHEVAPTCLVEIGPAPHLLRLAERADLPAGIRLLHPAPGPDATGADLAEALGGLYVGGVEPYWDALYEPEHRRAEPLAPYVFSDARRYWQTARPAPRPEPAAPAAPGEAPAPAAAAPRPEPGGTPGDPVLSAVIAAVVEVGEYPPEQVHAQARFYEDLGFDSVMIMQLKDRIERHLPHTAGLSVQQLLPALRSVGSLAAFVQEWAGAKAMA